ncbi:MAG: hypothetical protein AAGF87_00200 [Bacteroidota bacterium]
MPTLKNEAWQGTIFGLVFIGLIIGLTVELNFMSRCLDARDLAVLCAKASVALAFLASLIIWDKKQWSDTNRYKAIVLAALVCMTLAVWATLFVVRMGTHPAVAGIFNLRKSQKIEVELVKETAYYKGGVVISPEQAAGEPDRYLSVFNYEGDTYELSLTKPLFSNEEPGEITEMEIVVGLFGYRYVVLKRD